MGLTSNTSARLAQMEAQRARDEAEASRLREEQRQQRINEGATRIAQLFDGAPVMGTRETMASFNQNNLPTGWLVKARDVETTAPAGWQSNGGYGDNLFEWYSDAPITTTMKKYGIYDAAGNLQSMETDKTDDLQWSATLPKVEQYDTGERTGGIPESYYQGAADNIKTLGTADLTSQFNKARENLQYALARSGLLSSSAAQDALVDLKTAKDEGAAKIGIQATQATQKLRQQAAQEKAAAISQLYATQNPDLAANTALTNKTLLMQDKPSYSPIGDIFGAVLGGLGSGMQYMNNVNAGKVSPAYPSKLFGNEKVVGQND